MLYYLFKYLDEHFAFPGAGVFQYISFRALMAAAFSLLFATIIGKKIINMLQRAQVGETIRNLGLQGEMEKKGTPTMGGLVIISTILLPVLLFAKLENIYIILLLITTVWMGMIGFVDDYIKIFKKDKKGLKGRFKIAGQVSLGLIIGVTLYFHNSVVVRDFDIDINRANIDQALNPNNYEDVKSTKTTIPFVKRNEFDYSSLVPDERLTPILYVLIVIFIVTAVSNGANITDGIDGLAAGSSAIIGLVLAILAYVSGNIIFADYLNIMFLPYTGEVVIFCLAFVGACVGFLWYNSYPAQVFMGDTGSLMLGAVIAVLSLIIRKELLLPILCGIFFIENMSVILQVSWFKYTRKKYGEGRRIFLMSPIHHHYQKKGIHEAKIVTRFWIVGILLGIAALATLKIR
ncbi:phospho-N-acetylmuramoyl-pentapeptide-transferase [Chondrinema litorale]|uniref:phospho-N-acetylmuramoyl-pentapeptide- transferase n=1 Tax=Chondrinema litorale TaxID=2994555 RepID=UPI00254436BD|nr:phospho-N-acetylmuramoyl-pentapeptide-transferase [Chondrinema litorale]UZR93260.1 phospho-N-acetylmuramoyl-pentapeptide-transferase [Chondrinema litorale]